MWRSALIGLASSFVSDLATNWIRVIKTTKQTSAISRDLSYREACRLILGAAGIKVPHACPSRAPPPSPHAPKLLSTWPPASDGRSWRGRLAQGLLFRGLSTRILANGLQSMVFTVFWRLLAEDKQRGRRDGQAPANAALSTFRPGVEQDRHTTEAVQTGAAEDAPPALLRRRPPPDPVTPVTAHHDPNGALTT